MTVLAIAGFWIKSWLELSNDSGFQIKSGLDDTMAQQWILPLAECIKILLNVLRTRWMYWERFQVFEVSWIFSVHQWWDWILLEGSRIKVPGKIWTPLCCDDSFMGNCFWIDSVVTKTLSLIILFLDWRHVTFYRHWWELLWSFHGYILVTLILSLHSKKMLSLLRMWRWRERRR